MPSEIMAALDAAGCRDVTVLTQDSDPAWAAEQYATVGPLRFYPVPRAWVDAGPPGVGCLIAALRLTLRSAAEPALLVTFSGYADDPRELAEIPEVVAFCRAVLRDDPGVLLAMADEHTLPNSGLVPQPDGSVVPFPGRRYFVLLAEAALLVQPGPGGVGVLVDADGVEAALAYYLRQAEDRAAPTRPA